MEASLSSGEREVMTVRWAEASLAVLVDLSLFVVQLLGCP